ncbi:MAG: class II aldolase/adducin family protein [Anaerolineales bacterium]
MLLLEERTQIVEIGRTIVANGLAHDGQGNISIYNRRHAQIAITPSGIPYEERQAEDICIVSLEGTLLEGRWQPTSEIALHLAFYQKRPDVNAVLHTHAKFSTVYSITGKPSMPIVLAEAGMLLGGPVPVAPYARPGTEAVGEVTVAAIGLGKAALMANHGLVTVAEGLDRALKISVAVEEMAHAIVLAGSLSANPEEIEANEAKILAAMYDLHLNINKRKP